MIYNISQWLKSTLRSTQLTANSTNQLAPFCCLHKKFIIGCIIHRIICNPRVSIQVNSLTKNISIPYLFLLSFHGFVKLSDRVSFVFIVFHTRALKGFPYYIFFRKRIIIFRNVFSYPALFHFYFATNRLKTVKNWLMIVVMEEITKLCF